jgi:hypothetical protein
MQQRIDAHHTHTKGKGKDFLYRPRLVPGDWRSQISRQSTHEGGKVISPRHQPPLPPRKYSWNSCLLEAESTPAGRICQTLNTKVGHIWSTGNIRQKKIFQLLTRFSRGKRILGAVVTTAGCKTQWNNRSFSKSNNLVYCLSDFS